MQGHSKRPRKQSSLEVIFWSSGIILAVWYVIPSHWYAQPIHMKMEGVYLPTPTP